MLLGVQSISENSTCYTLELRFHHANAYMLLANTHVLLVNAYIG